VITRASAAYPASVRPEAGLWQVDAANPVALAEAVMQWSSNASDQGLAARRLYDTYFSEMQLQQQLLAALTAMNLAVTRQ
jgi:hypothetical protein